MAFGAREFVLKIVADVKDATKGIDQVEQSASGMSTKVSNIGRSIATGLAVGAVANFGRASVLAASEAQQSVGAMSSVFGEFADDMDKFGSTSAENLGITQQAFNQLSAVTGSLLKNAGLPMEQVTKSTQDLTSRASDLSAMFGTDVTDAVEAMGSAFKGEFDSLEKYGVSLKASDIEARAMAEGYVDASGKVTDAGKAIATQELIMEQSAAAAGTFAAEADTLAGRTQIMTARFNDTQAELGAKLLPIVVQVMDAMMPMVDLFIKYADILVPLGIAIGALVLGMKAYQAVSVIATAAQWLWNAALAANPIGIVVLGIAALVAGFVLLYTKVDWFRELVDKTFNWIKDNWPLLLAIITGPFGTAVYLIVKHWDTIKDAAGAAIDWIKDKMSAVWDFLTYPFRHAYESIKYVWELVKGIFVGFVDSLKYLFGQIYDIITYPFRRAIDTVKWLWNSTLGGFGFSVPSWIPVLGGREFKIPKMAEGGIVRGPTLAMIGESGPEAVVPLDKGGLGNVYNINVYALNANAETGRLVAESLREYNRTTGGTVGRV